MRPAVAGAVRALLDPVLAVVFPSRCCGCAVMLAQPTRGPLCASCWQSLPRHLSPLCGCGVPLAPPAGGICGRCRRGLSPFAAGASLGPYQGHLRTVLHELKYHGRQRVAARLAERLLRETAVRGVLSASPILVPVPLHPRRRRQRGFNQAELIALELARRTGLQVARDALVRRVDTPPQTGLSAAGRRANVSQAFAVRRRARVAGRAVVLVDDVLTTGATVGACARALRRGGASEVRLITVARVA